MKVKPEMDYGALVSELVQTGFTKRDADLLVAFVPMALSRPILEQLGVSHFVERVSAKNRSGEWVESPLADQPVYTMALAMAREQRRGAGVIDKEAYKSLAQRCSSINAMSNASNAGVDVKGATVATALISLRAEDLRAVSWVSRLKRAVLG
jgi:hypothetical protein